MHRLLLPASGMRMGLHDRAAGLDVAAATGTSDLQQEHCGLIAYRREERVSGTARSAHHLSLDLARAHDAITRLTRELAEERALTSRLRAVIALADLASPAIKRYMPHPRRARRVDSTHA